MQAETKRPGLTKWLKRKLRGKEPGRKKEPSGVDTQFLSDLSDIQTVGRYEIMGKLGQGSMGVVYQGRDPYINRTVSIKISRPPSDTDGVEANKYRQKFFLEAQSAGKLMHPNIIAIYDAGMYRDFCYITMEYIGGPTLVKFCKKAHLLSISRVVEIMFVACKALDYAHKKGVIHRDIKPSNIMLTESGDVRITDFGIAQIKADQTTPKGIVGSPAYMSPEQMKEEHVEDKSDIFSLGCVLYELLTGQKAFPGDNYFSIMYKIVNEDPIPMRETRPEIPEMLLRITMKALSKDPAERYQTCMDLAFDLKVALRGLKGDATAKAKMEEIIDYVHNVPFFENFNKEQVREILNASNIVKVPRESIVVTEGEIDDSFYVILSGRAAVHKNNRKIAVIERGECFGEMAYLSGQARAATVLADRDSILMKISATLLDRSSENMQLLFLKNFAMALVSRLSKSINQDL